MIISAINTERIREFLKINLPKILVILEQLYGMMLILNDVTDMPNDEPKMLL